LKPIHIPKIAPAKLPASDVMEKTPAPNKPVKYPPAIDPITIPSIISDFRDM
jgi:hypothetical protein